MLFVIPNLLVLIKQQGLDWSPKQTLMFALIFIWGVRLSLHIGLRHTGVEDFRYQNFRRRWTPKGKLYTYFMGFSYVFMMQAAFSVLINWASLHVTLKATGE
jgi:steroid 5-alpha reductase family enzyme